METTKIYQIIKERYSGSGNGKVYQVAYALGDKKDVEAFYIRDSDKMEFDSVSIKELNVLKIEPGTSETYFDIRQNILDQKSELEKKLAEIEMKEIRDSKYPI